MSARQRARLNPIPQPVKMKSLVDPILQHWSPRLLYKAVCRTIVGSRIGTIVKTNALTSIPAIRQLECTM